MFLPSLLNFPCVTITLQEVVEQSFKFKIYKWFYSHSLQIAHVRFNSLGFAIKHSSSFILYLPVLDSRYVGKGNKSLITNTK